MKFLVDAQLPRRMVGWLAAAGGDAIHTLDLPHANRTSDVEIIGIADKESRVVVTKDADFVNIHLLHGRPGGRRGCCSFRRETLATENWRH